MDVTRRVLDNVALYVQWREAQRRANQMEDVLLAQTPHMTRGEKQAYSQITGLADIGTGTEVEVVGEFRHGVQEVYPPPSDVEKGAYDMAPGQ